MGLLKLNFKEAVLELTKISKTEDKYIASMFLDGDCIGVSFEIGHPESIRDFLIKVYRLNIKNFVK